MRRPKARGVGPGFWDVPGVFKYHFWKAYTDFTRQLATRADVDVRTLDRALEVF